MISPAFILLSLLSSAYALNDWSKPCFDGECSYDNDQGSVRIWGSSKAISDITTAGGWKILNCDPNTLVQDIRVVCEDSTKCGHLYEGAGAVNTLVRLPENCGKSAFARIARMWVHEDQSIPDDDLASMVRRVIADPGGGAGVQGVALDQDFAAVDPATSGEVNMEVQGSNVPGAIGDANLTPVAVRRSRIARGLGSFLEDAFDKFNSFDKTITKTLPPIDQSKTITILPEQKVSCPAQGAFPAIDASLKADVVTNAHAVISLGVVASGTIVPPKISDFGVFAGLDASLDATLEMVASVTGVADSGKIKLFEAGIPGLDFPGLISVGPTFKVFGQAKATLDIDVDMKIGLSYAVNDAKLFFPKSANHASGGGFNPADTPVKLSVSPSIASKAVIEAHVIPTLDLGISAIGGKAKATVFLELDAFAAATLALNAQANAGASVTPGGATGTEAGASIDGCFDVATQFDVNAGADADFFGIFGAGTKVGLFSKRFELFKKCFGASTGKRGLLSTEREVSPVSSLLSKRFDLKCPTSRAAITSAVDEKVPAASIKPPPSAAGKGPVKAV